MLFVSRNYVIQTLVLIIGVSAIDLPLLDASRVHQLSKRGVEDFCASCIKARDIVVNECVIPSDNNETKAFSCICQLGSDFWRLHSICSKDCHQLDKENGKLDVTPKGIQEIYCQIAFEFPSMSGKDSESDSSVFASVKHQALARSNAYINSEGGNSSKMTIRTGGKRPNYKNSTSSSIVRSNGPFQNWTSERRNGPFGFAITENRASLVERWSMLYLLATTFL